MAVSQVPEGYDGTAGRAKTTAEQPVSAECWVRTVHGWQTEMICLDSKVSMGILVRDESESLIC